MTLPTSGSIAAWCCSRSQETIAQRVEHYEMAAYGTVLSYAEHLGKPQISQILEKILMEQAKQHEREVQHFKKH